MSHLAHVNATHYPHASDLQDIYAALPYLHRPTEHNVLNIVNVIQDFIELLQSETSIFHYSGEKAFQEKCAEVRQSMIVLDIAIRMQGPLPRLQEVYEWGMGRAPHQQLDDVMKWPGIDAGLAVILRRETGLLRLSSHGHISDTLQMAADHWEHLSLWQKVTACLEAQRLEDLRAGSASAIRSHRRPADWTLLN